MNGGAFDGGRLSDNDRELHRFYKTLLNFTLGSHALMGEYREIHSFNREQTEWYNDRVFSYVRWNESKRLFSHLKVESGEQLIIVTNFDASDKYGFELQLPEDLVENWNLAYGTYTLNDQLSDRSLELQVKNGKAETRVDIDPLESLILHVIH